MIVNRRKQTAQVACGTVRVLLEEIRVLVVVNWILVVYMAHKVC